MRQFLAFIIFACCVSCKEYKSNKLGALYKVPFFLPQNGNEMLPVLVLDAGHGGEDPGAINDSIPLYEKTVTRNIVDAMLRYLDPKKVKVVQTRPGEDNVHRHDRIKFANAYRPSLLMTIHINSNRDTTAAGYEIGYSDSLFVAYDSTDTVKRLNPYIDNLKTYSTIFLDKLQKGVPEINRRGMVPRKDDVWMIYAVNYPSLLVEMGFISNRKDAQNLNRPDVIKKIAKTLAQGVHEILDKK